MDTFLRHPLVIVAVIAAMMIDANPLKITKVQICGSMGIMCANVTRDNHLPVRIHPTDVGMIMPKYRYIAVRVVLTRRTKAPASAQHLRTVKPGHQDFRAHSM